MEWHEQSQARLKAEKEQGKRKRPNLFRLILICFGTQLVLAHLLQSVAAVSKRNLTTESSIIRTLENSASRRPDPSVRKGLDKCSHRERFFLKKVGIVPETFQFDHRFATCLLRLCHASQVPPVRFRGNDAVEENAGGAVVDGAANQKVPTRMRLPSDACIFCQLSVWEKPILR